MQLDMKDRVVVVSGASAGIGRAASLALAAEGASLVLGARRAAELARVADEVRSLGTTATVRAGDLSELQAVDELVAAAGALGRIDGVVACVGSTPIGTVDQLGDEDWQRGFDTKFMSSLRLVRAALPWLRRQGGRVVLVAGNARRAPTAPMATSAVFNAALASLAANLSITYGHEGVGVVTVDPGPVATDRFTALRAHVASSSGICPDEAEARLLHQIPTGRVGSPEEVGRLIAFLASPGAAHVAGTSVVIDGGQSAGI